MRRSRIDITNDKLYHLYVIEKKSTNEISKLLNYDRKSVQQRLEKMGVEIRGRGTGMTRKLDTEKYQEIKKLYTEDSMTISDIAQKLNCTYSSVRYALISMGVNPCRKMAIDEDELKRLYIKEGLSVAEISKRFGCSYATTRYALNNIGVSTCKKIVIDEDELERLYIKEGLSLTEIGSRFGCSYETIRNNLLLAGITYDNKRKNRGICAKPLRHNKPIDNKYSNISDEIRNLVRQKFEASITELDIENEYNSKIPNIDTRLISESTQVLINKHKEMREELFKEFLEYSMQYSKYIQTTTELLNNVLEESANELDKLKETYNSIVCN